VRAHGDGATIVVVGVTPHHGDGNTASQGEGWQVTTMHSRGGTRDAHSRNRPEHHPRTRQTRIATDAILHDIIPLRFDGSRNEIIKRLLADTCELCRAQEHCEVHHIRKLADLKVKGRKEKPQWVQRMAARQRKTLVVCRDCHNAIHVGRPTRQLVQVQVTGEPRETETLMRGSERGRQKSASTS